MPEAWECLFDISDLPPAPNQILKQTYFVFIYIHLCAVCLCTHV